MHFISFPRARERWCLACVNSGGNQQEEASERHLSASVGSEWAGSALWLALHKSPAIIRMQEALHAWLLTSKQSSQVSFGSFWLKIDQRGSGEAVSCILIHLEDGLQGICFASLSFLLLFGGSQSSRKVENVSSRPPFPSTEPLTNTRDKASEFFLILSSQCHS